MVWLVVMAALPVGARTSLRALHVRDLSMRADRAQVQVGQPFHLAIHVHVGEIVSALDELVIPDVGSIQLLGDERQTTHAAGGTDVVETLTLEPTLAGRFTFAPAYLDAVDAHDGRPKRFSANRPVTVVVGSAPPLAGIGASVGRALRLLAAAALIVLGLGAAVVALIALERRRRRRKGALVHAAPAPAVAPPALAPLPPRSPRDAVAAALRAYRHVPALAALGELRAALFAAAGAAPGATLRDALATTGDHGLRGALLAAERTAFGPAAARDAAAVELLDATEAWLR